MPRGTAFFHTTGEKSGLKGLLHDAARTQRQRLDAIDEPLLAQLEDLEDEHRRVAWNMIRGSIGPNKKTRDRLLALEERLRRAKHER